MNRVESLGNPMPEHIALSRSHFKKIESMGFRSFFLKRSNDLAHGLPFWKLALQDGFVALTLILLFASALLEILSVGGIFGSRLYFGSKFDPIIYSEFSAEKSKASVEAILKTEESKEAFQQTVKTFEQDRVSMAMKRADQELKRSQTRQDETEIVQKRSEEQAEAFLQEAEALWKSGSGDFAIQSLQKALRIAPEYLPAAKKLASFYQEKQDWAQACFQWEKAVAIARPQSQEMKEIQQNLEYAKKRYAESSASPKILVAAPSESPPVQKTNPIYLIEVARKDLPIADLYDLRFNLRITLGAKGGEPLIDIHSAKIEVTFFDQSSTAEGTLIPIKILNSVLQPKGTWTTGSEQTLSLNYSVPRGYFRKRIQNFGSSYSFCGFIVQVFYRNQLQDSYAVPADILKKSMRGS